MTFHEVDRWAGMPDYFNRRMADAVYSVVSKMDDDEAEVFADMLTGAALQHDLIEHADVIEKALDAHLSLHGDRLREALLRSFVSKRATGESVEGLLEAAEIVSKDFHLTPQQRAENARKQQRDLQTGRFVQQHRDINYDLVDERGRSIGPADDAEAKRLGVATPKEAYAARGTPREKPRLSERERLLYQQAYSQVQGLVQGAQRRNQGDHFLHLHYPTGEEILPLPEYGAPLPLHPRRELLAASVSKVPRFEDTDSYDALAAMGGAVRGNYTTDVDEEGGNAGVERIRGLNRNLRAEDQFERAGTRVMTRIGATSQFLDESFTDKDGNSVLPRRLQAALQAGKVVGIYGPEAQNVIGPTADRAAYRYRGTERKPDRALLLSFESLHRNPGIKSAEDRREIAIHGIETEQGWRPSGLLNYFKNRLPKAELNTLQTKSGVVPPSEGIVIDKDGKVVTQAIGYGDDHYLPFNLKNLKALRGGEYIRTRTFGGPTTEDIYTGLMAGAKSVTVVSRNGVYTVEFDREFKGKRRYNDKAARMINRYGYLLDAVRNGEITTGEIDPAKFDEIDAQAASVADPDLEPDQFRLERARLLARERRNPTLSGAQRQAAAQAFLNQEALKHRTPDGYEMNGTELIDQWLGRQAVEEMNQARESDLASSRVVRVRGQEVEGPAVRGNAVRSAAQLKAEIARANGLDLADPGAVSENAIRAMGLQEKYNRYLEREERTYRESLKPLQLNGPGYQMALQALQEQFPYYIQRVEYHPWTEGANRKDSGYVRPKANRPAEALSGYFDERLPGKVFADTTRGQGIAGAERNVAYKKPSERIRETAERLAGQTGDAARNAGARLAGGAQLSASNARELRIQADRKILAELRRQTNFGPNPTAAGRPDLAGIEGGANLPLGPEHDADLRKVNADLVNFRKMPDSEIEQLFASPEAADQAHQRIKGAVDAAEKHGIFAFNPETLKEFRAEGKPQGERKLERDDVAGNLRAAKAGQEFAFGRAYAKGIATDEGQLKGVYEGDARIGQLQALGAPAKLDDADFTTKMDRVHADLTRRQDAVLRWQANGGALQGKPLNADQLPGLAEGYAKAMQLRRRFTEAQEAAAEAEAEQAATAAHQPFGIALPGGAQLQIVQGGPASTTTQAGGTFTAISDDDVDRRFQAQMQRDFGTT